MMAVQKDHIKAVWQKAKQRDPLVKNRVRRMNPQAGQDHSFLGKRHKTYL